MIAVFSLSGFYSAIHGGFLKPNGDSYSCIDRQRFKAFELERTGDKKWPQIDSTFIELKKRMSANYYHKVFLAQTNAMDYASYRFPAYSQIMADDLADDWLATVDFHKKFARDHSLHQPLTAYIVGKLLGYGDPKRSMRIPASPGNLLDFCTQSVFSSADYLLEYARNKGLPTSLTQISSRLSYSFWQKLFYESAIMAALFHDIGYPWQYVGRVGHSLGKIVFPLSPMYSDTEAILRHYGDHLFMLPFRRYQRTTTDLPLYVSEEEHEIVKKAIGTHGFPGAIAFLSLNEAVRKCPLPVESIPQLISYEWASMGIVMHDMVDISKEFPSLRLDFKKDPLSSIVSMADYLEEFCRPSVHFSPNTNSSLIRYDYACSKVLVRSEQRVLHISMNYRSPGSRAIAKKIKREETDHYFAQGTGYVDMSSLGFDDVFFHAE